MSHSPKQELKNPFLAPKPDDSALRQFVGYHLKRAYNVLRTDLLKVLEPFGLRITTYSSLVVIVENPGIRQSELARFLDIERPNLVVILDDLEQRGLVNRERVETDRRAYALFATLAGRQACEKALALDKAHEARLLDDLDSVARDKLIEALRTIERSTEES